jgi:hypothetical protein
MVRLGWLVGFPLDSVVPWISIGSQGYPKGKLKNLLDPVRIGEKLLKAEFP